MAMTLSTSEVIPVTEGKLALGTWQSVLFFDLYHFSKVVLYNHPPNPPLLRGG